MSQSSHTERSERRVPPRFVVLWHFTETDKYTWLWLGDDHPEAQRIAASPAPALEPGEAIVLGLGVLRDPAGGALRTCPVWCMRGDPHYHRTDDGAHIVSGYENFEPAGQDAITAEQALDGINRIRNSIIGAQAINWSEHIYPLVALLNRAGYEGLPYPEARANIGTLIDRAEEAEAEVKRLRTAIVEVAADGFDSSRRARAEAALNFAAVGQEHAPASTGKGTR